MRNGVLLHMEDADEVAKVAAELLRQQGPGVLADLREQAELAGANGDELSAGAWADIADAVEDLLRRH